MYKFRGALVVLLGRFGEVLHDGMSCIVGAGSLGGAKFVLEPFVPD